MKKQVVTLTMAFGLTALVGMNTATAQARQTAAISFSFEAGGVAYPEGTYRVERLTTTPNLVKLTNETNGHAAVVSAPVISGKAADSRSVLVFSQNGERMKLAEVKFSGYSALLMTISNRDVSARVVVGLK